ncbi:MAG: ABC transporter permease [Myxococcaceae bacterium]|nr:ABC transporter permease [Myxococcaceae bacterium]
MSLRVDVVEGLRIAVTSLSAHRLRTVLTTVGVGIGVATLLAIVGITQGLDASFDTQLKSLGSSSLYVSKQPWVQLGNWWEFRNRKNLTLAHVEAVRAQCARCDTVVPLVDEDEDIAFQGAELAAVTITGTSEEWPRVSGFEVTQGRFFSQTDDDNRRLVAVIGADVADTLFPGINPIGQTLRVGQKPFTVIGTLSRKGKLLDSSQDLLVVMPFHTFTGFFAGRRSVTIGVSVASADELDEVEDTLVGLLRRVRQTPPDKPDDFAINRPEQLASTYQQLTGALYAVALGIGLITLLVGGIGIMNIMLVSVRERTREIGVRRALGARRRTIVIQFMLEATMVSAVGGALGTFVGLGGAKLVSLVTPLAATVKPLTIVFGVGFAALVGLLFGIWPAARAAALDPVEALRQE